MSCNTCSTNIVLPKGEKGDQGPAGSNGLDGSSAESWKCILYNESLGGDSIISSGETTLTQMSATALESKMHQVHSTMSLYVLGDGVVNTTMRIYIGPTEVKKINSRLGSDVESTTRELPMFWRGAVSQGDVISLTIEITSSGGVSDIKIKNHSILINQEPEDAV